MHALQTGVPLGSAMSSNTCRNGVDIVEVALPLGVLHCELE